MESETAFANFRRESWMRGIVDTCDFNLGNKFATVINTQYRHKVFPFLDQLIQEDSIGNPIMHEFSEIGCCSGTLLRYIKIAAELEEKFGDLKNYNIVEIGGGYGGQCKVLHNMCGFKSYTVIDIPQCLPLLNKYLEQFNVKNFKLLKNTEITQPKKYDFVISNYALSEMDRKEQMKYINNIVKLAPRGYIIYNIHKCDNTTLSPQEFIELLKNDHLSIGIEDEYPQTHMQNLNVLITWQPKA